MAYKNILYGVKGSVATVTFNRPEVLNALNTETMEELSSALGRVKEDSGIRVLVLTGAGEKAFVAGADIRLLAEQKPLEARSLSRFGQKTLRELETLGKPSIAAVNGFALGGGCEMAMACSIRYASENARFGQPEINLGIMPGYGGTQRLARLVGMGRALEMNMTGDMVSAEEAHRIGLVNKVVPAEKLMDEVYALADKISQKSAPAIGLILRAAYGGIEGSLEEGLELESDLFGLAFTTDDKSEGIAAFLEKREAKFQHR